MQIFKKEKVARKLAEEHFSTTNDVVITSHRVLEEYLAGSVDAAISSAIQVRTLESEADALKRKVREVLFSGAFLPNIRSDVYRLIDAVDSVADKAETAAHFIVNQKPEIPPEFQDEINTLFGLCVSCYHELKRGLKSYFKPKGEMEKLQDHVTRVGELETQVDTLEAELTRNVFDSDMEKSDKMHLCQLLKHIALIADSAEDAADELEFSAMKSVV